MARVHRFEQRSKTARSHVAPKCYDAGFEAGFSGFNVARWKALVVIPVLVLIDKMFNMGGCSLHLVQGGSAVIALFGFYCLVVRVGVLS